MNSCISKWLLLAAFLFSIISCSKEISSEVGNKTGNKGDFYSTIDSKLWNADSVQLILIGSNGVAINGLSKTGEEISMVLPGLKKGVYTLNAQSASYALDANIIGTVTKVYISNFGAAGGAVTISSIDSVNKLVSGSFELTLINPADNTKKTITKGVFNSIHYTIDLSVVFTAPTLISTDTLTALIDGVPFKGNIVETLKDTANQQLTIAGITYIGSQDIALIMPINITAGTYDLDFSNGNYVGIFNPNSIDIYYSIHNGKLTITSNNTLTRRIKGTFNFTASTQTSGKSFVITQGYFSVKY